MDLLCDVCGVLAVVAHPDDESFGLGAVFDRLVSRGARTAVLCFTHGAASTLHDAAGDLSQVRAAEFFDAVAALGVGRAELLDYPDGGLAGISLADLAAQVRRLVEEVRPSHLLVFDCDGVTGHADHVQATRAALAAADPADLPVLGWAVPQPVAARLNAEFGTGFVGRPAGELDQTLTVTRAGQRRAIACHRSQSTDNPVLRRRLELLGETEHLRLLRRQSGRPGRANPTMRRIEGGGMEYGMAVTVPAPFAETVDRVRAALKEQGFGVLTEIDVRATLQEKLGEQMEDYVILGACNPPLAHRALTADRRLGLLLPCNVVVRADGEQTLVEALDPQVMVGVTGTAELEPVAEEAARRLTAALQTLS